MMVRDPRLLEKGSIPLTFLHKAMRMMNDMMMMATRARTAANTATWENRAVTSKKQKSDHKKQKRGLTSGFVATPTAGHQLDVPPLAVAVWVERLAAHCDVLRLVEGHLAPHLAGLTRGTDANVGLDAQQVRFGFQQLPRVRLVAAPAGRDERAAFTVILEGTSSGTSACTVSPLVFILWHSSEADLLLHAVAAGPPDVGRWDSLGHADHQLFPPREVVVCQVFNLGGD